MRRKPIKPEFIGSLNDYRRLSNILEDNMFSVYGVVSLKICGQKEKWFFNGEYKGEPLTLKRIYDKWGKYIKRALWSEISICSHSRCLTFELDKKSNTWLLVDQNRGF